MTDENNQEQNEEHPFEVVQVHTDKNEDNQDPPNTKIANKNNENNEKNENNKEINYAERPSDLVNVTSYVTLNQFEVCKDKNDHEEINFKFRLILVWQDERVKNMKEADLPRNLWRPECNVQFHLKEVKTTNYDAKQQSLENPETHEHNERPMPKFFEGGILVTQDGETEKESEDPSKEPNATPKLNETQTKPCLLWIFLEYESDQLDMMEDSFRLKSFPFDTLRFDFVVFLSGERRLETDEMVLCRFGGV